jgi:hypothetical protein
MVGRRAIASRTAHICATPNDTQTGAAGDQGRSKTVYLTLARLQCALAISAESIQRVPRYHRMTFDSDTILLLHKQTDRPNGHTKKSIQHSDGAQ